MNWLEHPVGERTFLLDMNRLEDLLKDCDLLQAEDTQLCGWIRLLKGPDGFFLQEQDWQGQGLLHLNGDLAILEALFRDRLTTYERMWDGCGCKVKHLEG